MPKQYDASHNYYADLDLPATATCDDVKKQYRKLVLQYHPDRNIGKEEEVVPKFQAISAAHEVLADPNQKNKYDADRTKPGLYGRGPSAAAQRPPPAYGNPYQATSQYPPPPRRTQPGTWQRPPGFAAQGQGPSPGPSPNAAPGGPTAAGAGATPVGAERFANFPRTAPTGKKNDPAQDRTNMFRAWQNMNSGTDGRPNVPPRQPFGGGSPANARSKPQPPPRPPPNAPPPEEVPSGPTFRKPAPSFNAERAEERQSAWASFQQANASPAGMRRAKSSKTPKKTGFNPTAPGSDERAANSHAYSRHRSEDLSSGPHFPGPPPGPPPTSNPASPTQPRPRRPGANPTAPFQDPDVNVPYAEGTRVRTPYHSVLGEKTDTWSEGLRRSYSQRDTTKLTPDSARQPNRPRSSESLGQQKHDQHHQTSPRSQRPSFVIHSSSDSSDMEPELGSSGGNSQQATPDLNAGRPSPFFPNPELRPKKQPSPPSKRFNGPFKAPEPPSGFGQASRPQTSDGAHSETEQPSMRQKAGSTMYDNPFPQHFPSFNATEWAKRAFGSNSTKGDDVKVAGKVPMWAVPSSITPGKAYRQSDSPEKEASQFSSASNDRLWAVASQQEKEAFMLVRHSLKQSTGSVPHGLDMEVFMKLASTARLEKTTGNALLDSILHRALSYYPSVGVDRDLTANANTSQHSFNLPLQDEMFKPSSTKSRSVENINTKFTNGEWNGTFGAGAGVTSPPPPASGRPTPRPPSQQSGAASTQPVNGSASTQAGSMPPPPPRPPPNDSHGSPLGTTRTAPAEAGGFSNTEWERYFQDNSWMPPPPPPGGPPGKRMNATSRRATPRRGFSADEPKSRLRRVEPEGEENQHFADGGSGSGAAATNASFIDDAMDIDEAPLSETNVQRDAPQARASSDGKQPRMVSVPPSSWHQQHNRSQSNGLPQSAPVPKLKTDLNDLGNVEPLAKSAAEGLRNFADLKSNLPFQSQASTTLPTHPLSPQVLQAPPIPKAPELPQRLTKSSWHSFAQAFAAYLRAFHTFNSTILLHFQAREYHAEGMLDGNMTWLEAAGDATVTSTPTGFGEYLKNVKEDERVRETWSMGCERHAEAVKEFGKCRDRVRELALSGRLMET